ncbi:MAG: ADYC domain-containing protein [Myxococcota bacterium]
MCSWISTSLALSVLALAACDSQPSTCEAPEGLSPRGINFQGLAWNGIQVQGMTFNGIEFQGISMQGTTLVGVDGDEVVVGRDLGAQTSTGDWIHLRIDDAHAHPTRADITYYVLSYEGRNVCGPGGRGLFVPGTWDDTGAHDANAELVTFSCTTGVVAKCVEWGYAPHEVGAAAHQACTRMARADYCGDGVAHTREGTAVDIFDQLGVMRPESDDAEGMRFEAGWGPDGAVCVHEPRYDVVAPDGSSLRPACWDTLPECADEASATDEGSLLFNRSRPQELLACDPDSFRRKRPGRSK